MSQSGNPGLENELQLIMTTRRITNEQNGEKEDEIKLDTWPNQQSCDILDTWPNQKSCYLSIRRSGSAFRALRISQRRSLSRSVTPVT